MRRIASCVVLAVFLRVFRKRLPTRTTRYRRHPRPAAQLQRGRNLPIASSYVCAVTVAGKLN
jgi:hypothetical protein